MDPRERCLATKRDGTPCRRFQVYPDGLCIQHHRQAAKMTALVIADSLTHEKYAQDIAAHERMTGQHEDCPYCAPDEDCALHQDAC